MDIVFKDNSRMVKEEFYDAVTRALEKCGLTAEGYAVKLCDGFKFPTGNLRNSIAHKVVHESETIHSVYIGTRNEYAVYVELGTGKYYPGGRKEPWVYQDAKGNWHMTRGQEAHPFLKPAVADHAQTYKKIIENELKNG